MERRAAKGPDLFDFNGHDFREIVAARRPTLSDGLISCAARLLSGLALLPVREGSAAFYEPIFAADSKNDAAVCSQERIASRGEGSVIDGDDFGRVVDLVAGRKAKGFLVDQVADVNFGIAVPVGKRNDAQGLVASR